MFDVLTLGFALWDITPLLCPLPGPVVAPRLLAVHSPTLVVLIVTRRESVGVDVLLKLLVIPADASST